MYAIGKGHRRIFPVLLLEFLTSYGSSDFVTCKSLVLFAEICGQSPTFKGYVLNVLLVCFYYSYPSLRQRVSCVLQYNYFKSIMINSPTYFKIFRKSRYF